MQCCRLLSEVCGHLIIAIASLQHRKSARREVVNRCPYSCPSEGAPEAFPTWESGAVSHAKRGATRLRSMPIWGSAKWGTLDIPHLVKRGSSPLGSSCRKWIFCNCMDDFHPP